MESTKLKIDYSCEENFITSFVIESTVITSCVNAVVIALLSPIEEGNFTISMDSEEFDTPINCVLHMIKSFIYDFTLYNMQVYGGGYTFTLIKVK